MSWGLWVVAIFCNALLLCFAWWIGWHQGKASERMRAESLCHQAVVKRASGSVRWIWNAISSGQEELMQEKEFFGEGEE
jgi:hypothetical protein